LTEDCEGMAPACPCLPIGRDRQGLRC